MKNKEQLDVIIVGGSYSGLAAAMALGRALKNVLIIDNGKPCNAQTPHSHNFLTQDGKTPLEIASLGRSQVEQYKTVSFLDEIAVDARKTDTGFELKVSSGQLYKSTKLIFATGIKDMLPEISGLSACWGISVLHCPYCHGYEVAGKITGILGNGMSGFELSQLISNWTDELTLFTNGASTLTQEQSSLLLNHNIRIVEKEIESLEHENGHLQHLLFKDGDRIKQDAIYVRSPFEQHCSIPQSLGCGMTEEGYIKVDASMETTVAGVFACGDNSGKIRTVANAVAAGTTAGMMASKKMIVEEF